MFALRCIANSSHSSNHAQSMSRRAETQILCNRVTRQLEPFDERLERSLSGMCGRRCDRARQGPASSPAPAYIGAQRGGFPSALPARRRPEGFCVPTPRSGRTEERPRVSTAASHSIEGGRGPQHARRQPAASSGRTQLRAGAPSFERAPGTGSPLRAGRCGRGFAF